MVRLILTSNGEEPKYAKGERSGCVFIGCWVLSAFPPDVRAPEAEVRCGRVGDRGAGKGD